ncbi:MAG: Holliday junction branch migration protein RuvA [Candidatus Aureabacteria bacterium]|nr:Holliday junction branch migration protein RuvA [Candidatus Auribacterota bacterium]
MITFLSGELIEVHPTRIVIGVSGVGYELVIPLSTFDRLPGKGEPVTVLTHLHHKEDGMVLYGFMAEEERTLFRMLIGVSGIGPKIAIGILSGISPRNFYAAIHEGSSVMLATVPGIGRKKAERLIVELKDKIGPLETAGVRPLTPEGRIAGDAALALISLGYSQTEAQRAVQAALQRLGPQADLEKIIRESLKSA